MKTRTKETPLAIIIGTLLIIMPYENQRNTPKKKIIYIKRDMSFVSLNFQVLIT